MDEKTALKIEVQMIEKGAITIENGTSISDWLIEGGENALEMTIGELVTEWNEDLE